MKAPVNEGDVLAGKFVVEKVLGAGGMGVVVAARHLQLGSRVALKFVLDEFARDPQATARFLREAQSATRITSEHVARVLDVGQLESGAPYMVMELLDGSDLHSVVATRGPLQPAEAVDYVIQACHALAEAHAKGIVHRDIKPSNLFLTRRFDGSALVKVLDFGIAKASAPDSAPSELTQTQSMMGSPLYASPEQLDSARHATERSDVWALGVTLHHLVTGAYPFSGQSSASLIAEIMMGKPVPARTQRADLSEAFERVVLRCLERDPSRRYGTVGELVSALRGLDIKAAQRSTLDVNARTSVLSNPAPDLSDGNGSSRSSTGATTMPQVADSVRESGKPTRLAPLLAGAAVLMGLAGFAVVRSRAPEAPHAAPATSAPAVIPATTAVPAPRPEAPPAATAKADTTEPSVTPAAPTMVPSAAPTPPTSRAAAPVKAKPAKSEAPAKPDAPAKPVPSATTAPPPAKKLDLDSVIDGRH